MYFAIYQAIAKDERRPGLYREYAPDFFDLIIVDECHRGSASDESNWREILRILRAGLPARHDGDAAARGQPRHLPLLRQPDLHLQPAAGHRRRLPRALPRPSHHHRRGTPPAGGRARASSTATAATIPDEEYQTKDFERVVALKAPHRGDRPAPHGVSEEDRPLRQDHRLLRRPGARRRDARERSTT